VTNEQTKIVLLYDDDAYRETLNRSSSLVRGRVAGLMGRQVAGREFLDAYLEHGAWTELVALVRNRSSRESIKRFCSTHASSRRRTRRLQIVDEREFHQAFFPTPPSTLLYTPWPLEAKYAWARAHAGPDSFALCGVTHTLCSQAAIGLLTSLVTAPFEPYDALICTSSTVSHMVRSVTGAYSDYLRERHGGEPRVPVQLAQIPLGVNTDKFCPASDEQRARARENFRVASDEVVVLFVGRLSHHAKAHPFPMFQALAEAARVTEQKTHLLLAGWAANQAVAQAFMDGARAFAPNVRISMVDGTNPRTRSLVWHAADIFMSLSDNIQETFGLVIIEAMASGLPVVASDWNGYRDLVRHGETGYLVRTTMVYDATRDATSRLLVGEISYDQFLAESSQTVGVDLGEAAQAVGDLLSRAALRRRMGEMGRKRAMEQFAWPRIIGAYEELWRAQEVERLASRAKRRTEPPGIPGPSIYPAPEHSFANYPTRLLQDEDLLVAIPDGEKRLKVLLSMPLTNHAAERRSSDHKAIESVLAACSSPRPIAELDELLRQAGVARTQARATLAWMLKYGLLKEADS
jgi:glycosyltransferase involved in cell wall biosynthesis